MIVYRATRSEVDPVEVERVTDRSVWINGSRRSRTHGYCRYYDTEKQAWDSIISAAKLKVKSSQRRVITEQIRLAKLIEARDKAES